MDNQHTEMDNQHTTTTFQALKTGTTTFQALKTGADAYIADAYIQRRNQRRNQRLLANVY
ncbi:hypothetical protein AB6D20_027610 (plasmid) [Vibrio splendidus]